MGPMMIFQLNRIFPLDEQLPHRLSWFLISIFAGHFPICCANRFTLSPIFSFACSEYQLISFLLTVIFFPSSSRFSLTSTKNLPLTNLHFLLPSFDDLITFKR